MPISLAAAGLISAGTSSAGSIGGSLLGNRNTKKAQKRAYQYGEMAAENAYQRQLDYWDKTLEDQYNTQARWFDEYDSEVAQTKRLRDAGLSPGLFYSGGAGAAGGSGSLGGESSAPQGSSYPGQGYDFAGVGSNLDVISKILSYRRQEAEVDNINADTEQKRGNTLGGGTYTDYIQSQTDANQALSQNTKAKTVGELLSNNLAESTLSDNIELARLTVKQNEELLATYIENADLAALNVDYAKDTYNDRVALVKKDIQLKASGVALQYALAEASRKGIHLTETQIQAIKTSIDTEIYEERPILYEKRKSERVSRRLKEKELDWFNANQVIGIVRSAGSAAVGGAAVSKVLK